MEQFKNLEKWLKIEAENFNNFKIEQKDKLCQTSKEYQKLNLIKYLLVTINYNKISVSRWRIQNKMIK